MFSFICTAVPCVSTAQLAFSPTSPMTATWDGAQTMHKTGPKQQLNVIWAQVQHFLSIP